MFDFPQMSSQIEPKFDDIDPTYFLIIPGLPAHSARSRISVVFLLRWNEVDRRLWPYGPEC